MLTVGINWIIRFETVTILMQAVKWARRRQHLDPSEEVPKTPKHTSESVGLSSRLVFAIFLKCLEISLTAKIVRMYCSCLLVHFHHPRMNCCAVSDPTCILWSFVFRICRSEARHEICAHGYSMCAVSQVLPVCQSAGLWALPSGHVCHLPRRQSRRAASQDKRYHQCLSQVWERILSHSLVLRVHV